MSLSICLRVEGGLAADQNARRQVDDDRLLGFRIQPLAYGCGLTFLSRLEGEYANHGKPQDHTPRLGDVSSKITAPPS
jgi:hypothetical protein